MYFMILKTHKATLTGISLAALFALVFSLSCFSQGQVVDRVVAVVGKNMILQSDIEAQYLEYRRQGGIAGSAESIKCQILEGMLYQKLLVNQAALDSVEVTDAQVEAELDRRIQYFIMQLGSKEKLEEFYGKSVVEMKEEFRSLIKDQALVEKVESTITEGLSVSPSEIKQYYKNLPADSIPLVNSEVEIEQIVKIPPVSMEQRVAVKEKLRELRKRVLDGENFATLAVLYSEDPGSAKKGGELGFYGRGELYPEFEAAAYKLKPGEISDIVETKAGYHIIQLIEKKDDYINARHILLMVKPSLYDLQKAKMELDSIAGLISSGSITFEEAAIKYSDDPLKNNGGVMINPSTGNTRFEMDELEPQVSFAINNLEVGQVSGAIPMKTEEGDDAYRLLKVKSRTEAHRANLTDDYDNIQNAALNDKHGRVIEEWVNKKVRNAYVYIVDDYKDCDFMYDWIQEEE
jgi:peptidyl-prolyl cis-trans isomerase SurA